MPSVCTGPSAIDLGVFGDGAVIMQSSAAPLPQDESVYFMVTFSVDVLLYGTLSPEPGNADPDLFYRTLGGVEVARETTYGLELIGNTALPAGSYIFEINAATDLNGWTLDLTVTAQ